ncbi:hypothetical protein KEM52_005320 [Ascosphaera acerosa]|nr:hypothetical protein KEM52_005320 [Ascosphaera acerosa]
MSVNSLLSQTRSVSSAPLQSPDHSSPYCISESETRRDDYVNFGHDYGHADLDLCSASATASVAASAAGGDDDAGTGVGVAADADDNGRRGSDAASALGHHLPLTDARLRGRSEGHRHDRSRRMSSPDFDNEHDPPAQSVAVSVFSKGGYYASPVPVNIQKFLMPLPSVLTQSPVNMLYFHHFLNHTGKILAPHACEHNPFTRVLPKMAITNHNLLNLLLAYSASHRARLLGHPEPAHRIAHWVCYVFPSLRHDLTDPQRRSSPLTLATAIMLVSLKIISPSTFEAPISWQDHLKLARELYAFYREAHVGRPPNQVSKFLNSWFGYIDILGSISCEDIAPPVPGVYGPSASRGDDGGRGDLRGSSDEEWVIECYSGFTPRTGALMFRLAELIGRCRRRRDRLRAVSPSSTPGTTLSQRDVFDEFVPPPDIHIEAEALLQDMIDDRRNLHKRRTAHDEEQDGDEKGLTEHLETSGSARSVSLNPSRTAGAAARATRAIDDAYQLACILQLYRRVLGRPSLDPRVRATIDELMRTLDTVGRGGSAEVCLLLPIFTVGCETTDLMQRQTIIERVRGFEQLGLKQIREARKLMQRTWEAGCSWTLLANGEFLG